MCVLVQNEKMFLYESKKKVESERIMFLRQMFHQKKLNVSSQCTPGIFNLKKSSMDFPAFEVFIYAKEFRISIEKHLSLGFQNSNPQKQVVYTKTCMYFLAMFTIVNFRSLMTNIFLR